MMAILAIIRHIEFSKSNFSFGISEPKNMDMQSFKKNLLKKT